LEIQQYKLFVASHDKADNTSDNDQKGLTFIKLRGIK